MLQEDIYKIFRQAQLLPTFINLGEVRQRVIVELIFNLGFKNVHAFTRMWEALENDKFEDAADEMLNTRWAQQNRTRAKRMSQWMRMGDDS